MALSEHCSSQNPRSHWKCEQGGCECRCHETVIYAFGKEGVKVQQIKRRTRKLSPRGNWLVVTFINGDIYWAQWVQTWAGVQASKRNAERDRGADRNMRVIVLDIERMIDFAVTEGANEIADLERLMKLE